MSNADVAFATAFGTLVSGAFLVGYVKNLGGSDVLVNLLGALPSLVGLLQIPGGIIGRGAKSYKRFVAPGGIGWRVFFAGLVFLPLAHIADASKLALLTICVAVASISTTFVGPVYNDWIAQLVPETSRGFYFARRNAIGAAVGALIGILGAAMLDMFRSRGRELEGFTAVYGLGILCAAISWFFFTRMSDLERLDPVKQNLRDGLLAIKKPFADRRFRTVLLFLGASMAAQTFAGNLFIAYGQESLGLDYKVLQGTAVSMAIGNVVAAATWGFLADKYGNKPMLAISGAAIGLNPIAWIVCAPHHEMFDSVLLLTTHVLMGVMWAGINLCQFNLILATAEPKDRSNYIGAAMTVMAVAGGVAPLLGGVLMGALRGVMPAVEGYRVIFGMTGVMRVAAVGILWPVRERGSTAVKDTLRGLSGITVGGVRALRTLSRPTDVATREHALDQVGAVRATLAADEVIKSLHDPLPQVRRRAAAALARLDDPRAAQELVHQIEDHPDLLEEETINALGAIGRVRAVSPLLRVLDSPRPLLRRAAARALGEIGARLEGADLERFASAEARLVAIAKDQADPDLRRSALQALRFLPGKQGHEAVAEATLDQWPSVRIAAAEAVQVLSVTGALANLRESLRLYHDEANAEIAYALARVGSRDDIPTILDEAARSVSVITRRRCLLGVAYLLGVEAEAYRLFLMDGMALDGALQELLRPQFRKRPFLREGLALFGSGDEAGAVRVVAAGSGDPALVRCAERPVEELFLVVAARSAK